MITNYTAQQIVEAVHDVSGCPINYISPSGTILASTNSARIGTYHEIGYRACQQGKTLEVQEDNVYEGSQKGINIPFQYHGNILGAIGITGEPDAVRKYGHLALRIMRLLMRERELEASKEVRRAEFSYIARALLHGETLNSSFLQNFLESQHMNPDDRYRVLLIQLLIHDRSMNITTLESDIETAISSCRESFFAYDYPSRYYLILSENSYTKNRSNLMSLASDSVHIAAGTSHHLSNLNRSYQNAVLTMKAQNQSFCEFESLDLELLFSNLSAPAYEAFLNKTIASLSEKDRHLLNVYFANNLSLKNSSEELFIHKNTLQYQLNRIASKTGKDPRVFSDAAALYLGLRLLQCRS